MGLISDLHPLNLAAEKTKFFQSDTYNPQFHYLRSFSTDELNKYGKPTPEFEEYIKKMIARHQPIHFPTYPQMSTQTFSDAINNLCAQLQVPTIPVSFTPHQTARIMLTKNGLSVRTPIFLDNQALEGLLNHEIQTHYLRRLNHQNLPVDIVKAQDPIQVKYTEEGLALLHTYLPAPQPFIKQFVGCYAQIIAQQSSFRSVYNELIKIGLSEEMAFRFAFKQKRGLEDTSNPGGFSKTHVYVVGASQVAEYFRDNPNLTSLIYLGKISINYLQSFKVIYDQDKVIRLPLFFENRHSYMQNIFRMVDYNDLINIR